MTPNGEVTHDIYYQKYLKYKAKYLELKKLLGGGKCTTNKCQDLGRGRYTTHIYSYGKCKTCGCYQK